MKKNNYTFGLIFLVLIGLLFISMFASTAYTTIKEFGEETEFALASLTLSHLFFMIVVIVLKGVATKQSNDYEILASLPFDKRTIILAKVIKDFVFDFIALVSIMMPQYVCYYLLVDGIGVGFLLRGLVITFFFAIFSNAIPIIMQSIVYFLTKNLRNANIIQTLLTVLLSFIFIVFYYFFYMSILDPNSGVVENLSSNVIVKCIIDILLNNYYINILWLFLFSVLPLILGILIKSLTFKPAYHVSGKNGDVLSFKPESIINTLLKNESNRYFNSSIYVLNTFFGGLMMVFYSAIIIAIGPTKIIDIISTAGLKINISYDNFKILLGVFLALLSATIISTCASISIEGKQFWILKVHPIDEWLILKSKLLFNCILILVPSIISTIILAFVIDIVYLPFILIIILSTGFASSCIGLLLNLKYYRFDWQQEEEIIKNSMALLLSMAFGLLEPIFILLLFFVLIKFLDALLVLSICVLIGLIFSFILLKILKSVGIKRLRNIYE